MLVGVTGYAQHGKDTVANLLVAEYGFTRIAFADALKSMAYVLDPIVAPDQWLDDGHGNALLKEPIRLSQLVDTKGWEFSKQLPEVRRFLQVLGTEGVRDHLGEGSWVQAVHRQRESLGTDIVIPDVRFPNEAAYVKEHGFLLKVVRVNQDGSTFDNGIGTNHPSEAYIDKMPADSDVVASDVETLEQATRSGMGRLLERNS
jgi:hypothetical protein